MRFHSLAPYGARRHLLPSFRQYGCFNSLAPYGARHILRDIGKPDGTVSIHQLLTELDPHSPTVALTALKFQFTSSLRSQTISSAITQSSLHVSIHQLLTELDISDTLSQPSIATVSIHQLLTELDQRRPSDYHGAEVSIHQLLTELDVPAPLWNPLGIWCFNSLAPYGARHPFTFCTIFPAVFQFTSSLRSQTHTTLHKICRWILCFNSLAPYGARQEAFSHRCHQDSVSIHQLLTELDQPSVQVFWTGQCFNSLAPYGARPFFLHSAFMRFFMFQFTSSLRRQTIALFRKEVYAVNVSIHQLLTELDRSPSYASRISWMFQFTSSLRSQTNTDFSQRVEAQCFNSLAPYGARQSFTRYYENNRSVSIHQLLTELDVLRLLQ